MSVDNFKQTIWSARLLANLEANAVFTQEGVINSNYQGEAKEGATVKINQLNDITVGDYTGTLGAPENLSSIQKTLLVDQQDYFSFQVDDADAFATNVDLIDRATQNAGAQLADAADKYVAGLYVDAHADNLIGDDAAPTTVDKTNVYDYIVQLGTKLNKKNVPKAGRFVVVGPEVGEMIRLSDKLTQASRQGEETIRNGVLGNIAGFTVLETGNAPEVTGDGTNTFSNYKVVAGHSMAITYADGLEKVEAIRRQDAFADNIRGLHIYGAKVVKPEALAVLSVKK